MRQILLLVLVFIGTVGVKAQDVLVATLQSGDNASVFYGADALKNAVNAATTGDLITLSAGTFNSLGSSSGTAITKFVKIQGAGYIDENNRTIISGNLYIKLNGGNTDDFLLEGVYIDGNLNFSKDGDDPVNNIKLKRCRFADISFSNVILNADVEHCRIAGSLDIGSNVSLNVVSSIIKETYSYNVSNYKITYINSIIFGVYYNEISTFTNCILNCSNSYYNMNGGCTVSNCLGLKNGLFKDNNVAEPWYVTDGSVWESEITGYSDTDLYKLKSEYKKNDTEEVGIYGGFNPYKSEPSNPQIISKNIATKSSEGKLKVEIKLEAQEK